MFRFDSPILLIGSPRSGKSLIASILNALPEFSAAFEPITIWNIGMSRRADDVRTAEEATDDVVGAIRAEIGQRLARQGASRHVDDLPHNTLRISFCRRVLPEAKFIHVVCDPAEAIPAMLHGWQAKDSLSGVLSRRVGRARWRSLKVSSLPPHMWKWALNYLRSRLGLRKVAWGPTVPGQDEFAAAHGLAETVAFQWATIVQFALEGVSCLAEDRVLEVRREHLIADPSSQAARLAEFCEVTDAGPLIAAAQRIIDPAHPPARVEIPPEQWMKILQIISPMQRRLGYDATV